MDSTMVFGTIDHGSIPCMGLTAIDMQWRGFIDKGIHTSHRSAVEARQAHNLEDLGSKPSDAFFVPAV